MCAGYNECNGGFDGIGIGLNTLKEGNNRTGHMKLFMRSQISTDRGDSFSHAPTLNDNVPGIIPSSVP